MRSCIVALLLLSAGAARATTWGRTQLTDPLTGKKVDAFEVMSYGSYIYDWDSKYDLVFWPLTDPHAICLDPENGYAAFNPHFEELPAEQRKPLAEWLAKNYDPARPPRTHLEKLAWLEKVYGQRGMDDAFWSRFYRLMAFVQRDDRQASLAYVRKAMPLLEKKLAADPKDTERLEVLFLLGEYHRRLGDEEAAQKYFGQVKDVEYLDEEQKPHVGHPYFLKLVEARRGLKAGGEPAKKEPGAE